MSELSTAGGVVVEHHRDGVVEIALDRPDKHNAMTPAMRATLAEALSSAGSDGASRVIVLTGRGRSFCAGEDIKGPRRPDATPRTAVFTRATENLSAAVAACPLPVVAALHGHVLGRGLDLALAADLRVGAEGVRLGLPEIGHGMLLGGGGARRLARIVGEARALELLLLGDPVDGPTALAWGLLNRLTPTGKARTVALDFATRLARASDFVLYAAKASVRTAFDTTVEQGGWIDTVVNVVARRQRGEDDQTSQGASR